MRRLQLPGVADRYFQGAHGTNCSPISISEISPRGLTFGDVDTLNFNALNQPIQTTPNTISVGGVLRVNHINFETVANQNTLGGIPTLTINSPTPLPEITVTTPFISLAGTAADDVR